MVTLFFFLGDEMYAVKCDRVREVSPMVALKKVPQAPDYFAGLFHYRGLVIPVVDLCRLVLGKPCRMRLSTRIIVAEVPLEDNTTSITGFIAERVTEASRKSEDAFIEAGVQVRDMPYLGGVLMEDKKMIHLLDLDQLVRKMPLLGEVTGE